MRLSYLLLAITTAHAWVQQQPTRATRRSTTRLAAAASDSREDIYQRVFYRLSPDSEGHDAIVVEERCRFVADPERPDTVLPTGPRTLILRDGKGLEDGTIGDDIFGLNVRDGTHDGAGTDLPIQSTVATALYLASNPDLCQGRMLQVDCDLGLASLLGCTGAAFTSRGDDANTKKDVADDILTISKDSGGLLPTDLDLLTLTDPDENRLIQAMKLVRSAGVSSSKVSTELLNWRVRAARPIYGRAAHPGPSPYQEYRTVVASDVAFSYPQAKELARAVANRLESSRAYSISPTTPRFVYICPNDDHSQDNILYLRHTLEKGCKMTTALNSLTLEKLTFHLQKLPKGAPETALDDLELKLQEVKEIHYKSLTAQHHPDFAGEGSGELFFPLETGEYEVLEGDIGRSPW